MSISCVRVAFLCLIAATLSVQPSGAAQDDPDKAVYARACESCHGPEGNGDAQGPPVVPLAHNLAELTAIVRQGVGLMPAMPRSEVSDADIERLHAYLKRLSDARRERAAAAKSTTR